MIHHAPKVLDGIFWSQFMNLKSHAILTSMRKFCTMCSIQPGSQATLLSSTSALYVPSTHETLNSSLFYYHTHCHGVTCLYLSPSARGVVFRNLNAGNRSHVSSNERWKFTMWEGKKNKYVLSLLRAKLRRKLFVCGMTVEEWMNTKTNWEMISL